MFILMQRTIHVADLGNLIFLIEFFMCKLLYFSLFFLIAGSRLYSMEEQEVLPIFSQTIDFGSFMNINEKSRIEIHMFWTTGRPYELFNDKYGANRQVLIGGEKWAKKFNQYIYDFLRYTPSNVNIIFVCDQLTEESNKELFKDLKAKFSQRFHLKRWECVTKEICDQMAQCNIFIPKLKRFFDQGFCGNPAVASDIYRLIAMPLVCQEKGVPFDKIMWTYTDIDTFCHSLERKSYAYMKSLLETQSGAFALKAIQNNDIVKLGFESKDNYFDYVKTIVGCLSDSFRHEIHVMSYLSKAFSYLKENDFSGYLKEYNCEIEEDRYNPQIESSIMHVTGPYFAQYFLKSTLDAPRICTLEWSLMVRFNLRDPSNCYMHVGVDDSIPLRILFIQYYAHLRTAIATKCFGDCHPFNISLMTWLKENNPYMSRAYKRMVARDITINNWLGKQDYGADYSYTKETLEGIFLSAQAQYEKNPDEDTSFRSFFNLKNALKIIGIEFPLFPDIEGIFDYQERICDCKEIIRTVESKYKTQLSQEEYEVKKEIWGKYYRSLNSVNFTYEAKDDDLSSLREHMKNLSEELVRELGSDKVSPDLDPLMLYDNLDSR